MSSRAFIAKSLSKLEELGKVEELKYPKSHQHRSVDVTFKVASKGVIMLKLSYDAAVVNRQEREELGELSQALGVNAFIVAERRGEEQLLSDVIYDIDGVKTIHVDTIVHAVNSEEPAIYEDKDGFKVKVNGSIMRSLRLQKGYSLGELAMRVHVTRKAIYEYERGTINPSIDVVERLTRELGEEVVEPIDIFNSEDRVLRRERRAPETMSYDNEIERAILRITSELGIAALHARRSPLDVGFRIHDRRMLVVVDHINDSYLTITNRVENASKLASAINGKAFVVASDKGRDLLRGLVDIDEVYSLSEFLEVIRGHGTRSAASPGSDRETRHR